MTVYRFFYRILCLLLCLTWTFATLICIGFLFVGNLITGEDGWIFALFCIGIGVLVSIAIAHFAARYLARWVSLPLEELASTIRQRNATKEIPQIDEKYTAYTEVHLLAQEINAVAEQSNTMLSDMRRLQHVRSQFLGNVSHELRTPIFAIQGYLESLLDGALEEESIRRTFVEKAYNNTKRLGALLNDLMDISRIESGEMRMSFRYFNISDVIRDVAQQLELYAQQHNVHIHYAEQEEVHVFGDKERIMQVLANLISNAIKYNKAGGSVKVTLRHNPDDVSIIVSDTGIGIAPEHQARVFERFYRADTNRSRSTGGTGLGLAIVKHILEAHNTTISLQSEVDVGTTMSFTLRK